MQMSSENEIASVVLTLHDTHYNIWDTSRDDHLLFGEHTNWTCCDSWYVNTVCISLIFIFSNWIEIEFQLKRIAKNWKAINCLKQSRSLLLRNHHHRRRLFPIFVKLMMIWIDFSFLISYLYVSFLTFLIFSLWQEQT
jgi:hypothetical protein